MRKLIFSVLLLAAIPAVAATAFFTGRSEVGQSVTGMMVLKCEYQYAGRTFWRAFPFGTNCPMQLEVY